MAPKQLPPRPNLDQLKRQAKELLHAGKAPTLHDAQTMLAREYGFKSWNALHDHVEAVTLEFDAALAEFLEAATDGRRDRAERMLTLYPRIATANFHTALILGDAPAADARLAKDPSLATKPGGPRGWEPIHYVCYTTMAHDSPARREGLAAIARRLIALGADPNTVFAENGETPLYVVARAWDVPLAEAMVAKGADIERTRADGRTPYAVAELNGNRAVADSLLAHGASSALADVDRLVAACSQGDRAAAEALLAKSPDLRDQITDDHYIALHQAAERNDVRALEAMLACGFDPNRPDAGIGKTALHSAAMEGWPDAVRVLLAHGASVHVRDREFKGPPLIWAAEGSRQGREGREFATVGRLLLDAGSPVAWETTAEPAEGLLGLVEAWRRGETT